MRPNLRLVPPKAGRTPNYYIRGSYLGHSVEQSTKTGDRATAKQVLAKIKEQIKRGEFAKDLGPTFAEAGEIYMKDRGERRFMALLLIKLADVRLAKIDQALVDRTAYELYPNASPATRNRQVYTPILAVLAKAKVPALIDRPRGGNGTARMDWLTREEVEALIGAAWKVNPRFGALLTFLFYTGCRLSEALGLKVGDLRIAESDPIAIIGVTKNGKARGVYLPPVVVRAIDLALAEPGNATWDRPRAPRTTGSVFHFTKSGALYKLLNLVEEGAGVTIPPGVSFHITRHTFGAWGRRYGKLDRAGLVATGAWSSAQGAASYDHIEISAAARAVDLFPGALGTLPRLERAA